MITANTKKEFKKHLLLKIEPRTEKEKIKQNLIKYLKERGIEVKKKE